MSGPAGGQLTVWQSLTCQRRWCRFYAGEMAMSTFVLTAAFYGIFSINRWSFSIFLTLQGTPGAASPCQGRLASNGADVPVQMR